MIMSKVTVKAEFIPLSDMLINKVKIFEAGEFNFVQFSLSKPLLKDVCYELEVILKEKDV